MLVVGRFGWLVLALTLLAAAPAEAAKAPKIKVLSNRADLISSGDALVAVNLPKGVARSRVRVRLNGRGITRLFAKRENGRFEGLVTGLRDGGNRLTARIRHGAGARITITGHPNGGPVFSGPQVQPWKCQSTARDKQCNQPTKYEYRYKSST